MPLEGGVVRSVMPSASSPVRVFTPRLAPVAEDSFLTGDMGSVTIPSA